METVRTDPSADTILPLLRVLDKSGAWCYVETKPPRPCRICKPVDPDYNSSCLAYEVTQADFLLNKLTTRVFTDCLQQLQDWKMIRKGQGNTND